MSDDDAAQTVHEASGTFTIEMEDAQSLLDQTSRYSFTKRWSGDLSGTSRGFMISAGDPEQGEAGYVAMEVFLGELDDQFGTFALQQFGVMSEGEQKLQYVIAPGSGSGELTGISGTVELTVVEGEHRVVVRYVLG